jgi:hypothetical protein
MRIRNTVGTVPNYLRYQVLDPHAFFTDLNQCLWFNVDTSVLDPHSFNADPDPNTVFFYLDPG